MAENNLVATHFHDEDKAREYLEGLRWPHGAVCPHCGSVGQHYALKGKAHRPGLWKCVDCREQFSVTVGTVFERSKIPLTKWLMVVYLLCSSKKGISSHQIHRTLAVTYKTAWFMSHRIREAMKPDSGGLLGGGGKIVEADETYYGNDKNKPNTKGIAGKQKILSLAERGGTVRSFHITNVNGKTLKPILKAQIARDSHLMTDEANVYRGIGLAFEQYSTVNHSLYECARGDVTTNTVEGYCRILKRGLIGTYHHVSGEHLKRYVGELDFRYNNRDKLGVIHSAQRRRSRAFPGSASTYRRTDLGS